MCTWLSWMVWFASSPYYIQPSYTSASSCAEVTAAVEKLVKDLQRHQSRCCRGGRMWLYDTMIQKVVVISFIYLFIKALQHKHWRSVGHQVLQPAKDVEFKTCSFFGGEGKGRGRGSNHSKGFGHYQKDIRNWHSDYFIVRFKGLVSKISTYIWH